MIRRSDSGSSRSPSDVDSTRSQKTTLMRLRSSVPAVRGISGAPQRPQKLNPTGFSKAQLAQATIRHSRLAQETPELDTQPGFATPGHHLALGDLGPLTDAAVANEEKGNRVGGDPAIHRRGRRRLDGKPAVDEAENLFGTAAHADLVAGRNAFHVLAVDEQRPRLTGPLHDLAGDLAIDRPPLLCGPCNVIPMYHHLTHANPDQGAEAHWVPLVPGNLVISWQARRRIEKVLDIGEKPIG